MKKISIYLILLFLAEMSSFAQVGINNDSSLPNSSAMLDVKSTVKGFLPPRMTAIEMNAIATPATGLLVFNTTENALFWYNGSNWKQFNEPFEEIDPVFSAHPAKDIAEIDITNWNTAYTNRVTSASGTLPLTLAISANTLTGSIATANAFTSGILTDADWNDFNNKISSPWISNGQNIFYNSGKVGIGTSAPLSSAALEVASTNSGVLLPRMTRLQRNAISAPAEGLMVYCTNCGANGSLSIFTSGSWMTFAPCNIAPPVADAHVMSQGQIIWNWLPVAGASGYKWNTTSNIETATDLSTATSKLESGTTCGTAYNRYVWAYSSCGESPATILTSIVPAAAPAIPVAATHVSTMVSVVWNWNTVPGATGYKWNTTNNLATATDMAAVTTKNETGLDCGTAYTRYVWAYNGCGSSTSLSMVQSTLACWLCNEPITRIHNVSGGVAPVDKTVTYGTVTGIPGEPDKCWITSNLGSSRQATAVSDATELSAGWYWQFNQKQGYKNDGSTRTPGTLWNSSISEVSDWTSLNDPCTIELGSGWRIPTSSEYSNTASGGGWTDWNGPFNSGLKMHAAGSLGSSSGSLGNIGVIGTYWSSTQSSSSTGWDLYFGSGDCSMINAGKAYGFPIRCLREN